jgi:hypothetical protein
MAAGGLSGWDERGGLAVYAGEESLPLINHAIQCEFLSAFASISRQLFSTLLVFNQKADR